MPIRMLGNNLPATSYLMAVLVVVIGICSEQTRAAVSDLVTMLVIMIRAIRQDARATEDLLHGFRLLSKQRREQETVPAPKYMKACPRFCYHGCGLFLPQKNEVQGDTDQDAGKHSPGNLAEHNQQGRNTGQSKDDSQCCQYLAALNAFIHVEHCYTSSSVRF